VIRLERVPVDRQRMRGTTMRVNQSILEDSVWARVEGGLCCSATAAWILSSWAVRRSRYVFRIEDDIIGRAIMFFESSCVRCDCCLGSNCCGCWCVCLGKEIRGKGTTKPNL
jgi:hypothetical protein